MAHGVCRGACGRRTLLWLPARLCEKCLCVAAVEMSLRKQEENTQ